MEFFKGTTTIDFIGKRNIALAFSGFMLCAAVVTLVVKGLNFGIDFTGGTIIEIGYEKPVELKSIRDQLKDGGYDDAIVQHFGTASDVLVRLVPRKDLSSAQLSTRVVNLLRQSPGGEKSEANPLNVRRIEFVGPQVGDELTEDGGLAMLYALIGILIYVALRFEFRFALGAVAALVHDVLFTVGIISMTGVEFNLTVLAALLAVIGYSLNDTIVVFDRVRENFRKMRKGTTISIMNASVNQTLSRTIMTSLTTLLVLVALFLFGGEVIHGFAFALIVGIVVGTYSSIYIAATAALLLGVSKADLIAVSKSDEAHRDQRP